MGGRSHAAGRRRAKNESERRRPVNAHDVIKFLQSNGHGLDQTGEQRLGDFAERTPGQTGGCAHHDRFAGVAARADFRNERDLADFVALQKTFADSENSWTLDVTAIDTATYDLSAKNPNKKEETALRAPQEILEEMRALDEESAEILNSILELI